MSYEHIEIAGHTWPYYTYGNPDNEALLLLSGGGGKTEALFQYIERFSGHFYVIAPDYPVTLKTLSDTINGLHGLLSHAGIERCVVVGISFGGILAQLLIRRFQEIVTDLVITHCMIPSKHLSEALSMQYQLVRLYPQAFLLWMGKQSFQSQIEKSETPAGDDVRQFWQDYVEVIYNQHMTKRDLVLRARLTAEYHAGDEFNSRDLLNWHGDLLIIESEQDEVINDGDRGSLKAMYSRAYIQTLEGHDHLAPLLAAPRICDSITNFLHREEP